MEVGHLGETNETLTLREMDRSSDGTIAMTRQQSAEQEIWRDAVVRCRETERAGLLDTAQNCPPVLREWAVTPLDDRLLVKMASFREGYVCKTCDGTGMASEACPTCEGKLNLPRVEVRECIFCAGTGKQFSDNLCPRCQGQGTFKTEQPFPCQGCLVTGAENRSPFPCGHLPCRDCHGRGLANGMLAVPDESKQDHSYGDIVVCGMQIHDLAPGDRVLFSKQAGIYIKGNDGGYILLRRGEVMGLMTR